MQLSSVCHVLAQNSASSLWISLIPVGKFKGRDGRAWNNINPEDVISNTELPLMLDVDHQSELTTNTAASGWIVELKLEKGEILGKLELNDLGKSAINNKHYKYYSPAFLHTDKGEVTKLISIGLTNKPNLNVPALNSTLNYNQPPHNQLTEDNDMLEILKLLGLDEGSDENAVLAAIKQLQDKVKLAKDEKNEPALNAYVPRATYDQVETALNNANAKLAQITQDEHNRAVETALNSAIKAKKIAPSDLDYYKSQCATYEGLVSFNSFIAKKAPIIGDAQTSFNAEIQPAKALNSEQENLLKQLNLTAKDIQGA